VLDATFGQEASRKALASALARKQAEVIWIELTASDALIRRRLKGRDSQQQVVSDARLQDFSTLAAWYASPGDAELNNLLRVRSTGRVDTVMKRVLDELIDRRMDQVLASKSMPVRR
jgi:ribose 1,5-bisphosphokinase PhnN